MVQLQLHCGLIELLRFMVLYYVETINGHCQGEEAALSVDVQRRTNLQHWIFTGWSEFTTEFKKLSSGDLFYS